MITDSPNLESGDAVMLADGSCTVSFRLDLSLRCGGRQPSFETLTIIIIVQLVNLSTQTHLKQILVQVPYYQPEEGAKKTRVV